MPRTYTNLCYHIVFATKQRLPVLSVELREELYAYIGGVLVKNGAVMTAIGGVEDHVHVLVSLKPDASVAKTVQWIKGSSSNWINKNKKVPDYFAWQEGYGAFTVSESQLATVRSYIERQEEHHQTMSHQKEMTVLLRRNNVDFKASDFKE